MSIRAYKDTDLQAILHIYRHSKLDELRFEEGSFTFLALDKD